MKYWKFYFPVGAGNDLSIMIGEITLLNNGVNQMGGASASSDGQTHAPISGAIDGNDSTFSQNNAPYPHWVVITLPAPRTVTHIRFFPANQLAYNPTAFILSHSLDGVNWTEVKQVSGIVWSAVEEKIFSLASITITGNVTKSGGGAAEI